MRKNITLSFVALSMATSVFALPVKKGIYQTLTLADGTTVSAQLMGDEHRSWWQSDNGMQYILDSSEKFYKQVKAEELEYLLPAPTVAEAGLHKTPGVQPTSPVVGDRKGLIILVEFSDVKFQEKHNREYFEQVANGLNFNNEDGYVGSVRDYFRAQSGDKLDYTFDVVGPITMTGTQKYYGSDAGGQDYRIGEMLKSAINAVKADLNFADYDNDGDGEVDNIFFLYAGKHQADTGESNLIWPHMYYLPYRNINYTFNGKKLNIYACSSELQGGGQVGGIGAICHEFSHCLGLNDMYNTASSGSSYGGDDWSIMHSGCYLGSNFRPCGYTAFERWFAGWLQPTELTEAQTFTDVLPLSQGGPSFKMTNDYNTREYYLVEMRRRDGWDKELPNDGLLVWHIDYKKNAWIENTINNDPSHQRCFVVPADNSTKSTDIAGDVFPSNGNNMFTDESTPATTLFNANSDGTKLLHKSLYNIKRNSDGYISFSYMPGVYRYSNPDKPTDALFYEGFERCSGTGGNDGKFGNGITTASFTPDDKNWTYNYAYGGDACARFGTSLKDGWATTPMFTITDEAILTFLAAPYYNDPAQVELKVASGNATIENTVFPTEKGKWTKCEAKITGSGEISIKFMGYSRFLLDEVLVMPSGASVIESVEAQNFISQDKTIYNLAGQKVNKDYKGVVIIGGKKFISK